MKFTYIPLALMCALAFTFVGCIEENFKPYEPAEVGDEIAFGARAGFEKSNSTTKTVYGDEYSIGNRDFQRIDWLDGKDRIEIYCPEAAGERKTSHYLIKHKTDPTQDKDYASLERDETQDGSLQWGSDDTHNFYAMYPSSQIFVSSTDGTLKSGVKMDRTIVRGVIPSTQAHAGITRRNDENEISENGNNWVAAPNMDYAYMVAYNTGNRKDGLVPLSFYPIVTAVEVQLKFDTQQSTSATEYAQSITITHVKIDSEQPITGEFSTDLSEWNQSEGYPVCESTSSAYENSIRVPLWYDHTPNDEENVLEGITLTDNQTLTFTVFLLPGKETDINDLKVSFSTNGGSGWIGKELTGITITKNAKNRIVNLELPVESKKLEVNAGNWITQLEEEEPNRLLRRLSLPGTGGSFSFNSNDNGYAQQHKKMNIDEQWKMGIRAFEIVSDRPQEPTTSLGGQPVRCNGKSMGNYTIYSALKELILKVTNNGEYTNSECAVAILTYQPEGTSYIQRRADAYAASLNVLLETEENEAKTDGLKNYVKDMILYTPDLTLEQAKNKLIIIVRINQEGESEPNMNYRSGYEGSTEGLIISLEQAETNYTQATTTLANKPVLLINGCGTAKDKWRRRGYYVGSNQARNMVPYNEDFNTETDVEPYLVQYGSLLSGFQWYDYANITIDEDAIDFEYQTNANPVWFQEWARVSPGGANDFYTIERDWFADYRWHESYNEKLDHAIMTFDKSINNEFSDVVVINSLCGYYVSNSYNQSYIPFGDTSYQGGTNGDIINYATDINRDFYSHVAQSDINNTTGPTGIILMDFVDSDQSAGGSFLLPGVIINNNF